MSQTRTQVYNALNDYGATVTSHKYEDDKSSRLVVSGDGTAWVITFDSAGRYHEAWRTDVDASVLASGSPRLRDVLKSLGVRRYQGRQL